MIHALIVVAMLLAPWALLYLVAGVAAGPALLGAAHLRHGLRLQLPGDLATATLAWPAVGAHLALVEMARHRCP